MEAIAAAAAVSKATLYSHFTGKAALFGAIVEERCQLLLEPLAAPSTAGVDLADRLHRFALRVLERVSEPEAIALYRLVLAEAPRFPELAQTFYACGPERAMARLAEVLAEAEGQGMVTGDPHAAAELFFTLLMGPWHTRVLLGLEAPEPAILAARAEQAVQHFLLLCRKAGGAG
jgi:TetR/AcrR family transcriptional repressor of mexJK operon